MLVLLGLVTACQVDKHGARPRGATAQESPDLRNITLKIKDLAGKPARLVNGAFQGDHLSIRVLRTATADLNRDGLIDGAVIVLVNSGGSGNFRTLCLLMNDGEKMVHTDGTSIGDRIRITDLNIDGGTITVDYMDRALKDSFAVEPYVKKRRQYRVRGMKLRLVTN